MFSSLTRKTDTWRTWWNQAISQKLPSKTSNKRKLDRTTTC
jgi:hypothetical protein